MSISPGASSAFKPEAAPTPAGGVKPQQVGGVKFPGKISMKIAMPNIAASALANPALGAVLGLLFGRAASNVPGLRDLLSNPVLRDAALGAAIAQTLKSVNEAPSQGNGREEGPDIYNPRPADPGPRGWNLQ